MSRLAAVLAAVLLAAGCSSSDDDAAPSTTADQTTGSTIAAGTDADYRATIRRSEHNVPHIEAGDLGSVGFGYGYAISQDHGCTLADIGVLARGERAKWHGPGPDDAYIEKDFVYTALDVRGRSRASFDAVDPDLRDVIRGYAAGYNHHLDEVGADGFAGWCQGAPWVQPLDEYDLMAYFTILAGYASVRPLLGFMASAAPPGADADEEDEAAFAAVDLTTDDLGSNAWAIGPERTLDGTTMLVGNPHFPWQGAQRFYEVHLTVPGVLDVYGASLLGSPAVNIGFTEGVAWSHTVSAGHRFTGYTLQLQEGDPTSYLFGDEVRRMTPVDVDVEVLQDDGSTDTVSRTMWFSHYGPMIDFPGLGWSETQAVTFRDANADNDELLPQFFDMNLATTMDEFIDAHRDNTGIPWVNTVAASADGRIWYADTSAAPNLSAEAIERFEDRLATDVITQIGFGLGFLLLDGSDPVFEWVDDPAARDSGVVPFEEMPQLERDDFLFNANDSYWIANPAEPVVRPSPVFGRAGAELSPRTRINARQLAEAGGDSGADGRYSFDELVDSVFSNRVLTAEVLLDDLLATCSADVAEECAILRRWDRRVDLDSPGAVLWREFIAEDPSVDLFRAPFDPADPIGTPADLTTDGEVMQLLARAGDNLREQGVALDSTLRDLQYADRGDVRVPIHGGRHREGVANIVGASGNDTTTEPEIPLGDRAPATSQRGDGYPVTNGTSFVYALEFTADGPVARSLVTYGNTGDPDSPFYADQTQRFSDKNMKPVHFPLAAADVVSEVSVSAPR